MIVRYFFRFLLVAAGFTGMLVSVSLLTGTVSERQVDGQPVSVSGVRDCSGRPFARALAALSDYERSFAEGQLDGLEAKAELAMAALRHSLACAPVRPDLWTAAARLASLNDGAGQTTLSYLGMSCRTGPTQPWNAEARLAAFGRVAASSLPATIVDCLDRDQALIETLIAVEKSRS